ncbi:MAG: nucleotidyltransferase domain-containing protein [Lamprobacter sp.]|uniref:nucleotidyltransferase family protein n=1 Tax=Lamprobacter sp. TaxID=3100796 RepID=UPI002B2645DA|nr:nucleotidyltransferase domain-containing protein [Lamprobacter sp.]MEA3639517.1 nucleotidyltransferase domain-containing protein [Lamprobacter sp.]
MKTWMNGGFDFHRFLDRQAQQAREALARSSTLLEQARVCARPILERYGAERALVFGSVAAGQAHRGSDLDLLVLGTAAADYWALREELETAFERPLDLITEADDPQIIQQALAQGVTIYGAESTTAACADRG